MIGKSREVYTPLYEKKTKSKGVYTKMKKRVYATKDELRELDIRLSNDYIGVIESSRWVDYLNEYEVVIEFDSKDDFKQFCDMYGYKTSRLGDRSLLHKIES